MHQEGVITGWGTYFFVQVQNECARSGALEGGSHKQISPQGFEL